MSEGHARLGPSNHRWPHCPGSIREEANYPDVPGEAAIDGTGSHLLLEYCMKHGVPASAYDGQIIGANHKDNINGWMIHQDRIERVQMCLDYITRRVNELEAEYPHGEVYVEAESVSNPGKYFDRDDWWGTCDITILVHQGASTKFIETVDYKDGRGWVTQNNNTQLQSYMFGKMVESFQRSRPIEAGSPVRMTIVQPKTNPVVRYHDVLESEMWGVGNRLNEAAERTDDPNAPLIPDEKNGKGHCQWCKHKKNCEALKAIKGGTMSTALQQTGVTDVTGFDPTMDLKQSTNDQLTKILDARKSFEDFFSAIEEELTERINSGVEVPGYAMLPGRMSQKWAKPAEEVEKALKARRMKKDEIYPAKLISPAQALKHEKLTDQQRARLKKDYIIEVMGADKLTKVVGKPEPKDVPSIFMEEAKQETVKSEEPISFI